MNCRIFSRNISAIGLQDCDNQDVFEKWFIATTETKSFRTF